MSKKANPASRPVRGAVALLGLGLAESALSIFQWSQLLTLRSGGTTVCSVSEHVNCETVWNTPFASQVHETARHPRGGPRRALGPGGHRARRPVPGVARSGHTVRPAATACGSRPPSAR